MIDRGDYKRCEKCSEQHWTNIDCEPEYRVSMQDYDPDDYTSVRAVSFEDAAQKYAIDYNEDGDYDLMGETRDIKVQKEEETKYFNIGAEPDVNYTISETNESGSLLNE